KMNKFFRGMRLYVPLTERDMQKGLPGCTVRIVKKMNAASRVHRVLARSALTRQGVVICAPDPSTVGKEVYLNENVGIRLPYGGEQRAHITLEQLLRTCHADPQKILWGL